MNAAAKPKTLNFPERDPRVVVGEYITANNQRILARMTIGTYEMSVAQQENAGDSAAAAKAAITALAKERGQTVEVEKSREFIAVVSTQGEGRRTTVWITTPLEPTQSGHLCWARIREDGAERRIGIAWKLANEFSMDDVLGVVDKAEKALRTVPEGEPYVLSGNPPPRFAKKKAVDAPVAEAAAADAPAAEG